MSIEDEVRSMLVRRAADVSVGEAEWQRLVSRLEAETGVAGSRRVRPVWVLAAAAVVLLVVGAAVLLPREDDSAVQVVTPPQPTTTVTPEPTTTTTTARVAPAGDEPVVALYPALSMPELEALEAEVAKGARDDLGDPRAVAAAYVRERLGPDVAYSVAEFQQGDSMSGEVPYRTPPEGDGSGSGVVMVRKLRSLWYVVGSAADSVAVRMASYDGQWTGGEAEALAAGRLQVSVDSGVAGSGDAFEEMTVRRGQRVDLTMEFGKHRAVVLRVRFVGADGAVQFGDYLLPAA
ncbi:MAG TPA: hypothetical protein VM938_13435 [Acidimicrobiales bacterium]|nr:hypothetical protein [Acidimicrobiales bacterium]